MIGKFMRNPLRIIVVCACLLLFSSLQVFAQYKSLDLTNTVWNWTNESSSLVLTFTQGKAEQKGLVAILKGWSAEPLEFQGEYLENGSEPQIQLTGVYNGEKMTFTLKIYPGDSEQKPYLYGEFSTSAEVFTIAAPCEKQCPETGSKTGGESSVTSATIVSSRAMMDDLVGEWEDTSGAIGFKECWSIKFANGQWQVSGKFVKGDEVVGQFQAEEITFDPKTGMLCFRQAFNPKPDERWVDSNDIKATAQGDTLKFTVRGAEATLTRVRGSKK